MQPPPPPRGRAGGRRGRPRWEPLPLAAELRPGRPRRAGRAAPRWIITCGLPPLPNTHPSGTAKRPLPGRPPPPPAPLPSAARPAGGAGAGTPAGRRGDDSSVPSRRGRLMGGGRERAQGPPGPPLGRAGGARGGGGGGAAAGRPRAPTFPLPPPLPLLSGGTGLPAAGRPGLRRAGVGGSGGRYGFSAEHLVPRRARRCRRPAPPLLCLGRCAALAGRLLPF